MSTYKEFGLPYTFRTILESTGNEYEIKMKNAGDIQQARQHLQRSRTLLHSFIVFCFYCRLPAFVLLWIYTCTYMNMKYVLVTVTHISIIKKNVLMIGVSLKICYLYLSHPLCMPQWSCPCWDFRPHNPLRIMCSSLLALRKHLFSLSTSLTLAMLALNHISAFPNLHFISLLLWKLSWFSSG